EASGLDHADPLCAGELDDVERGVVRLEARDAGSEIGGQACLEILGPYRLELLAPGAAEHVPDARLQLVHTGTEFRDGGIDLEGAAACEEPVSGMAQQAARLERGRVLHFRR